MPKKIIQVEVESSSYDLGKQLGVLVQALIAKKPIMEIVAMELVQLQLITADIAAVKGDLAESSVGFYEGAALGLKEGFLPSVTA